MICNTKLLSFYRNSQVCLVAKRSDTANIFKTSFSQKKSYLLLAVKAIVPLTFFDPYHTRAAQQLLCLFYICFLTYL